MSTNGKSGDDFKPEVVIHGFSEKEVAEYIRKLDHLNMIYEDNHPIVIKLDSVGGGIFGLSQLYEHLVSLPNPIITYTASKALSAGAIILAAGGTKGMRVASPNSTIMVHELQGGSWGPDIKDAENDMDMMKRENTKWMGILARSMGLKSAKDVRSLLMKNKGRELWLSPTQAKKIGLIDEISYVRMRPIQVWDITRLPKPFEKKYEK